MKTKLYGRDAERFEYQLGDATVCIDHLEKPIRGHEFKWVWLIRESRKHAKKRSDATGKITFPHIHISVIKISQSFETYGKALISAIEYLNRKRKEGEL